MQVEWYKDGELLRAGTEMEGIPRSSESTILELNLMHVNFIVIISGSGAVYCFCYLLQRCNNGKVTSVVRKSLELSSVVVHQNIKITFFIMSHDSELVCMENTKH